MLANKLPAGGLRVGYVILLVLAASILTAGCDATSQQAREIRLIPAPASYERDIPIPAGFKLVENACEDQSTGTRRLYLRHLYQGKADKYAARKFFREQMPRARWALVSDRNVKGEYTLRFEKGTESCTVHITDCEGRVSRAIQIQVIIVQEERGQAPSNARKEK